MFKHKTRREENTNENELFTRIAMPTKLTKTFWLPVAEVLRKLKMGKICRQFRVSIVIAIVSDQWRPTDDDAIEIEIEIITKKMKNSSDKKIIHHHDTENYYLKLLLFRKNLSCVTEKRNNCRRREFIVEKKIQIQIQNLIQMLPNYQPINIIVEIISMQIVMNEKWSKMVSISLLDLKNSMIRPTRTNLENTNTNSATDQRNTRETRKIEIIIRYISTVLLF